MKTLQTARMMLSGTAALYRNRDAAMERDARNGILALPAQAAREEGMKELAIRTFLLSGYLTVAGTVAGALVMKSFLGPAPGAMASGVAGHALLG